MKKKRVKRYDTPINFVGTYDMWEALTNKAESLGISVAELMRRVTLEQMKVWKEANDNK